MKSMNTWKMQIPNALTLFRLVLIVPATLLFAASIPDNHFFLRMASLGCFLLAGLTDLLDGYLARKWNAITSFGKVADPLADKLMLLAVVICLCVSGDIPLFALLLAAAKELIMVVGGAILLRLGIIIPANAVGKIGTGLYTVAVALAFFGPYIAPWHQVVFYLAVVFSYFSLIQYGFVAYRRWTNRNTDNG